LFHKISEPQKTKPAPFVNPADCYTALPSYGAELKNAARLDNQ
jgi:hypothetical protein